MIDIQLYFISIKEEQMEFNYVKRNICVVFTQTLSKHPTLHDFIAYQSVLVLDMADILLSRRKAKLVKQ